MTWDGYYVDDETGRVHRFRGAEEEPVSSRFSFDPANDAHCELCDGVALFSTGTNPPRWWCSTCRRELTLPEIARSCARVLDVDAPERSAIQFSAMPIATSPLRRALGLSPHIPEGRATFDALVPDRYKQLSSQPQR